MSKITLKTPVQYDECAPQKCNQCQGDIFLHDGEKAGSLPPEHPKNPTTETLYFTFGASYCKECGLERGKPARIVS